MPNNKGVAAQRPSKSTSHWYSGIAVVAKYDGAALSPLHDQKPEPKMCAHGPQSDVSVSPQAGAFVDERQSVTPMRGRSAVRRSHTDVKGEKAPGRVPSPWTARIQRSYGSAVNATPRRCPLQPVKDFGGSSSRSRFDNYATYDPAPHIELLQSSRFSSRGNELDGGNNTSRNLPNENGEPEQDVRISLVMPVRERGVFVDRAVNNAVDTPQLAWRTFVSTMETSHRSETDTSSTKRHCTKSPIRPRCRTTTKNNGVPYSEEAVPGTITFKLDGTLVKKIPIETSKAGCEGDYTACVAKETEHPEFSGEPSTTEEAPCQDLLKHPPTSNAADALPASGERDTGGVLGASKEQSLTELKGQTDEGTEEQRVKASQSQTCLMEKGAWAAAKGPMGGSAKFVNCVIPSCIRPRPVHPKLPLQRVQRHVSVAASTEGGASRNREPIAKMSTTTERERARGMSSRQLYSSSSTAKATEKSSAQSSYRKKIQQSSYRCELPPADDAQGQLICISSSTTKTHYNSSIKKAKGCFGSNRSTGAAPLSLPMSAKSDAETAQGIIPNLALGFKSEAAEHEGKKCNGSNSSRQSVSLESDTTLKSTPIQKPSISCGPKLVVEANS